MFWDDSIEKAPDIVKLCVDSWRKLNTEYELKILDMAYANKVLKQFPFDSTQISMQALSDIVRINALKNYGGVWVDASLLAIKPLSDWLPKSINTGFFAFHCYHAKGCLLSSWFLAATKNHLILNRWWEEIVRYWDKPRDLIGDPRLVPNFEVDDPIYEVSHENSIRSNKYPYFWVHYLFSLMAKVDSEISDVWYNVPIISSTELHKLQHLIRTNDCADVKQIYDLIKHSPVEKLDWRLEVKYLDAIKLAVNKINYLEENLGF